MAILCAIESGVTWIDTAAVYGNGHAEEIVRAALRDLPDGDRPLVFTKGGVRVDADTGATLRDLSPVSLRAECELSMRRLGMERIDLYQLHWPVADAAVVLRAWETLCELRREGKIRWAGVSNFDVEQLERCSAVAPIDTAQLPLSLLRRGAGSDILPWLAARGTPALTYSPLESGILSGRFSLERLATLPTSDWRARREHFQLPQLSRALELVARLEPVALELDVSVAELAIAWTRSWPGVSGVIVGARRPEQVAGWIRAADLELDARSRRAIETALVGSAAGSGPIRPAAMASTTR
jgi:aryl-alcohol dehydrogenase-like predicted oxidoreductase